MSTYYFLPTRNVFGQGSAREAGELMKSLGGRKTMIVTDRFLGQNGMAQQIQDILTQSGVDSGDFFRRGAQSHRQKRGRGRG